MVNQRQAKEVQLDRPTSAKATNNKWLWPWWIVTSLKQYYWEGMSEVGVREVHGADGRVYVLKLHWYLL